MTYDPKIAAQKERNAEVFRETLRICRDGGYAASMGKRIVLPPMADVLSTTVFHETIVNANHSPNVAKASVNILNDDCIDVAADLVRQGFNPVMLNMASRRCPGGGVLNGARAQEETLFRRSNLCVSLYQFDEYRANLLGILPNKKRYPMSCETAGIYSGRVTFFRKGNRDDYAFMDKPFECAVISAAAISHPELTSDGRLVDWAAQATAEKIRNILRIGLAHGHDAIVLGAWGCGAFRNPPGHIAELFKAVISEIEFARKYHLISFAIIEDHNSHNANYGAFSEVFDESNGDLHGRNANSANAEMTKLLENNEIIDHAEAIRKIVAKKCARCRGDANGCMGCLFDSLDREMIPAMIDKLLSSMAMLPNAREAVVAQGKERSKKREETWREIESN